MNSPTQNQCKCFSSGMWLPKLSLNAAWLSKFHECNQEKQQYWKLLCFEWSPPWHSIHPIWHSVCHTFWHSIWHIFWHSIWHIYLAFHLEYLLTFYLAYLLTFYLAYLLTFYLAFYLAYLLTFYLAFYLEYLLTFYLSYLLTFYLAYRSGIPSGMSSDILSGISSAFFLAHSAYNSAGWDPAKPTALRISLVEVRRGPQRSDSRRLRSGEAHCDRELAVEVRRGPMRSRAGRWGPARPTGSRAGIWHIF